MKNLLTIFSLVVSFCAFAQQKGASPITSHQSPVTGATYAVVVGISNYQDEQIPDLKYADRDAEAFANFLRSPAGGYLDGDHLQLLTNEAATAGNIANALYWLVNVCKEADYVIIYFSGHGDVEAKFRGQPGFLLCWDAPPQVYMAGGTVQLGLLQTVISTLSLDNKAKVTVITDACRSGKLAGSDNNGSQLTNANLKTQYANEIKILSCQPDEYSIEGEQWGGGRGAFSYHLLDGLYGLADGDANGVINLREIRNYLEEHVSEEVAPQRQLPMTIGNGNETLASVLPEMLEQLRQGKKGQMPIFTTTDSRGIEEEVLAAADSVGRSTYAAFKNALKNKVFIKPVDACADVYFNQLIENPAFEKLHNSMRRNFAAAMQDDSQQVLNRLLKSDLGEFHKNRFIVRRDYKYYPELLHRAAELLGPEHYMYNVLKARAYWFEAYLMSFEPNCQCYSPVLGKEIIERYRKALEYQPYMPQTFFEMAYIFGLPLGQLDSAEHYAQKALAVAPNWLNVYAGMSGIFKAHARFDKSWEWLNRGFAIDSQSINLQFCLGNLYQEQKQFDKAIEAFDHAMQISPITAGYYYKGNTYFQAGRYEEAEAAYLKLAELDSLFFTTGLGLAHVYSQTRRYDEAEAVLKQVLALDSTNSFHYIDLGKLYYWRQKPEMGKAAFQKALAIDTTHIGTSRLVAGFYFFNEYWKECQEISRTIIKMGASGHDTLWLYGTEGDLFIKMNQLEKAASYAQMALKINPEDEVANIDMGVIFLKRKEYDLAEKYFNAVLQMQGARKARVKLLLGVLYHQTGRDTLAKVFAAEGLQENTTLWIVGCFFRKTKDASDWEDMLHFMLQSNPGNPELHLELCRLYANQGQLEKAFDHLELAITNGERDYYKLLHERNLSPLRDQTSKWGDLMKKHFPKEYKD